MAASRSKVSLRVTTLAGACFSLEACQDDTVGVLRDRAAALLKKSRGQISIIHGSACIGPDDVTLEACGISPPAASITILLTQGPVRVHVVTYADGEREFELFLHDCVGTLRERVAAWLEREPEQITLSYKNIHLKPEAATLHDLGVKATSIEVTALLDDPPWQRMHAHELLNIMKDFGLCAGEELAEVEELVSTGELSTKAVRGRFRAQLSSLSKDQVKSWKYEQWVEGSKARMKEAVSKRDELLVRRSKAFHETISVRPSYSHIGNGRTSWALIGGGPITEISPF